MAAEISKVFLDWQPLQVVQSNGISETDCVCMIRIVMWYWNHLMWLSACQDFVGYYSCWGRCGVFLYCRNSILRIEACLFPGFEFLHCVWSKFTNNVPELPVGPIFTGQMKRMVNHHRQLKISVSYLNHVMQHVCVCVCGCVRERERERARVNTCQMANTLRWV
jgi:hypothetical protein